MNTLPEGPTIHRLARDHRTWWQGEPLALTSPQGRFADGARMLDQCVLEGVDAVGKHLLYRFGDTTLHVHLGLFGRFRSYRVAPRPGASVRLRISGAGRTVDLTGPTDCAVWTGDRVDALLARLGPDPLDPHADPGRFREALARRRAPIGAALLDQAAVAGVGNVYRAELLFLVGQDPRTPAREVEPDVVEALWTEMVRLMPVGVRVNRIVTTDPATFGKPASRLKRDERLWVYRRRSCRVCAGAIDRLESAGRTLYWCPACQTRGVRAPG